MFFKVIFDFFSLYKVVKLLLGHGVDPNVPSINGDTSLHYATRLRRTDLIALLIAGGIFLKKKNTPVNVLKT